MSARTWRLDFLAARLGGECLGDGATVITGVGALASAGSGTLSFLVHPKYRAQLQDTCAAAVIVPPAFRNATVLPRIVHANPYACYARVAQWLYPEAHEVGPTLTREDVPTSARISQGAHIAAHVRIGEHVVIYPGCVIGHGAVVGDDSVLYPNVTLYAGTQVGRRCIIHAGSVLGADGFGFANDGGVWIKIPQIGRVILGDDVEIGANTTVDRGALDDTVIGDGVKLDNQIQIGHNVRIGDHVAMAGCVGVAGSARIGARSTIGGGAVILGHLDVGEDIHVSAGTLVSHGLHEPGRYSGPFPVDRHAAWLKNAAQLRRLDDMAKRVRELETRLAELEKHSK